MDARKLIVLFFAATTMFAGDITGTWKLNLEKSQLRNPGKSYLMKIVLTSPNTYRCIFDNVNAKGEKRHVEIVRIADGKEHTAEGVNVAPGSTEIVSPNLTKVVEKRDGKIVGELQVTFSSDGNEHTVVATGTDANGKPYKEVHVFERQ